MDSPSNKLSATEILERLRTLPITKYPEEEFASAPIVWGALKPLLIEEIRTVVQDIREMKDVYSEVPLNALILFTEFRAKDAWPAIFESIQLPIQAVDVLYSDSLDEFLPSFIDRCGSKDLQEIEPLIGDVKISESVRLSLVRAYLIRCAYEELPNKFVSAIFKNALERILREDWYGELSASHLVAAILACDPSVDSLQFVEGMFEAYPEVREEYESFFGETDRESLLSMDEYADVKFDRERQLLEEYKERVVFDREFRDLFDPQNEVDESDDQVDSTFERPTSGWDGFGNEFDDEDEPDESFPPSRPATIRQTTPRVGRNEPCPCGSGKKYKKCCSRA